MISAKQFREACASIITANATPINARITAIYAGANPLTVLPYYSLNFDIGSVPIVLLEQKSYRFRWAGSQSIGRVQFTGTLWGFVWHDQPQTLDDLASESAAGVFDVLNAHHWFYTLTDGTQLFFNDDDKPPVQEIQFGAMRLGSSVLRGWQLDWSASAEVVVSPVMTLTP